MRGEIGCRVREVGKERGKVRKFGSGVVGDGLIRFLFRPYPYMSLHVYLYGEYGEGCDTGKEGDLGPQIYLL